MIYPPAKGVRSAVQHPLLVVGLEVELCEGITLTCLPSAEILLPREVLEVLVVYIHLNWFFAAAEVRPPFLERCDDGYQLLVVDYVLPLRIIELLREEHDRSKLAICVSLSKYSLYSEV